MDLSESFAEEMIKLGYSGKPLGRLLPKGQPGTQRQILRGETADKIKAFRATMPPEKARAAYAGMRAEGQHREHPLLSKIIKKIPLERISSKLEGKGKEIESAAQSAYKTLWGGFRQHMKELKR